MLARSVSILLPDPSAVWMFMICVCTLITELMSRTNRPLIPAPTSGYSPWSIGHPECSY
ncbi:MAG: hypothetical protein LAQ30_04415 [Acidobacteriia bacterium]|nr:hypothetical protein [Terriglobia bacterium]